jgi:very-short-patch-repair endonuclease
VEVDGGSHLRRATADARRERWLLRNGWRVVRVSAELVLRQLQTASSFSPVGVITDRANVQ